MDIVGVYPQAGRTRIKNVGWRAANEGDLPEIKALSERIHPGLPEDIDVFAERLRLYPSGVLVCGEDQLVGYAITHPWIRNHAPPLNALIGTIPKGADTYYFHDVALDRSMRGRQLGSRAIVLLKEHTRRADFRTISLIAVNGSLGFWERHGFRLKSFDGLAQKLATYGAGARYMECGDF